MHCISTAPEAQVQFWQAGPSGAWLERMASVMPLQLLCGTVCIAFCGIVGIAFCGTVSVALCGIASIALCGVVRVAGALRLEHCVLHWSSSPKTTALTGQTG